MCSSRNIWNRSTNFERKKFAKVGEGENILISEGSNENKWIQIASVKPQFLFVQFIYFNVYMTLESGTNIKSMLTLKIFSLSNKIL